MKEDITVWDILSTILNFTIAFLCALCALKLLASEKAGTLRRAVVWIVGSAVWFANGILDLINQGILEITVEKGTDPDWEDL